MRITPLAPDVYLSAEPIVKIGNAEIAFLKQALATSPRGRLRICAHQTPQDPLHEMIIALSRKTYVRPHRHPKKSESFHIIEGEVDVVIFDEGGAVQELIELGPPASNRDWYYRLSQPLFHTLVIRSDILVIHETTNGPFRAEDTVFAEWAAPESAAVETSSFMLKLVDQIAGIKSARRKGLDHDA